jgi:hypothetical protein
MKLAKSTRGKHSQPCSGCPECNEEFARLLDMPPDEYSAWLAARSTQPRAAERKTREEWAAFLALNMKPAGVPPPPSLVDLIQKDAKDSTSPRPPAPIEPRPITVVALTGRAVSYAPAPPSLIQAIQNGRRA